jgi:hypothetical protein
MKRVFSIGLVAMLSTSQAMAWGLGEIGGKLLQKGVESAVTGKAPQTTPTVQQEVINQTLQSTDAANAQNPNSVEGVATNVASDVASNAATNALQNSGVPGAAAIGGVAGGLVKGFGGMFKKKPVEEQAPTTPAQ